MKSYRFPLYVMASALFVQSAFAEHNLWRTGRLIAGISDFESGSSEVTYTLENSELGRVQVSLSQRAVAKVRADQLPSMVRIKGSLRDRRFRAVDLRVASSWAMPATPLPGPRSAAVVIVNFNDAQVPCSSGEIGRTIFGNFDHSSTSDMYFQSSYGQISFNGAVFGPVTLNASALGSCEYGGWSFAAESILASQGINLAPYTYRIFVLPIQTNCPWLGKGEFNYPYSYSRVCQSNYSALFAHELGHNMGLNHAGTPTTEYGDFSCFMGNDVTESPELNAPHRLHLNLISAPEITQSGVYTVAPLETLDLGSNRQYGFRIVTPRGTYFLWYRMPIGLDAELPPQFLDRLSIHRYTNGPQYTKLLSLLNVGQSLRLRQGPLVTVLARSEAGLTVAVE